MDQGAAAAVPGAVERRCPFCGSDASAQLRHALWTGERLAFVGPMGPVNNKLVTALYQCERCERAVMLLFEETTPEPRLLGAWPRMRAHVNASLPPDVDADRVEAWNCFFGAEHRAALAMARSALRRALRTLEPESHGIERLVESGAIDGALRTRMEEAGLLGDEPIDELGSVDERTAERAVVALDDFLAATVAPPVR